MRDSFNALGEFGMQFDTRIKLYLSKLVNVTDNVTNKIDN